MVLIFGRRRSFATLEEQLPKSVLIQELLPVAIEIALDQDIIKGPVSKVILILPVYLRLIGTRFTKNHPCRKHALELGNPTDEDLIS